MQIDIKAKGFALTQALRTTTERRVRFALGSTSNQVRSIAIRLADENGPRGGVDKRCSIRATISGIGHVIIVHQESDLYVAIDRAADRLGRGVIRQLKKAQIKRI